MLPTFTDTPGPVKRRGGFQVLVDPIKRYRKKVDQKGLRQVAGPTIAKLPRLSPRPKGGTNR